METPYARTVDGMPATPPTAATHATSLDVPRFVSPLLELPGAVPAPPGHPEEQVPWHWGDPFAEQRTAARAAVVIDRSHREIYAVTGADRLSWLHLVVSQHVTELADGAGTEALILDSHGRIDTHMVLGQVNDTVWLDTDPGAEATNALPARDANAPTKQDLVAYLEAMKFWSKVDIADRTSDWALLSMLGPNIGDVLTKLGIEPPTHPYAMSPLGDGFVRCMPWPGASSVDIMAPREQLSEWWTRITEAGARPAGSWTFDALRVESLHPRLRVDTDERTIPHEVNWVGSAAHVAKGCYRGQETVAKVHNVGRPPRQMVLLHLDGSAGALPETGDPVLLGDRTVGRVGTVVQHHELGPIALALVKRSVAAAASPAPSLVVGRDDQVTQASIDPDSVPTEHVALGRQAAQRLRG